MQARAMNMEHIREFGAEIDVERSFPRVSTSRGCTVCTTQYVRYRALS
jgi:hypothetical protein